MTLTTEELLELKELAYLKYDIYGAYVPGGLINNCSSGYIDLTFDNVRITYLAFSDMFEIDEITIKKGWFKREKVSLVDDGPWWQKVRNGIKSYKESLLRQQFQKKLKEAKRIDKLRQDFK